MPFISYSTLRFTNGHFLYLLPFEWWKGMLKRNCSQENMLSNPISNICYLCGFSLLNLGFVIRKMGVCVLFSWPRTGQTVNKWYLQLIVIFIITFDPSNIPEERGEHTAWSLPGCLFPQEQPWEVCENKKQSKSRKKTKKTKQSQVLILAFQGNHFGVFTWIRTLDLKPA